MNPDLRYESEMFYGFEGRGSKGPRDLESRIVSTNDAEFCVDPNDPDRDVSPLARNVCRKIATIERDLERIEPGWFHVGCKRDVPKSACYVGKDGDCYAWVDADGREALTEFTLTVLKLSTLIKETQTLISPGSVKFSPGDRGG